GPGPARARARSTRRDVPARALLPRAVHASQRSQRNPLSASSRPLRSALRWRTGLSSIMAKGPEGKQPAILAIRPCGCRRRRPPETAPTGQRAGAWQAGGQAGSGAAEASAQLAAMAATDRQLVAVLQVQARIAGIE